MTFLRYPSRSASGGITLPPIAFAALLCAMLALAPRAAWAHAILVSSTPAAGSTVNPGSLKATLHFNSRVDAVRSILILAMPDGKTRIVSIGRQSAPETLSTTLEGLQKGDYQIRWQALSSDGHITRGEIPFHVR